MGAGNRGSCLGFHDSGAGIGDVLARVSGVDDESGVRRDEVEIVGEIPRSRMR